MFPEKKFLNQSKLLNQSKFQKTTDQTEIKISSSPKKRNYSQLLNETAPTIDTTSRNQQEQSFREDKEYFENLLSKKNLWKNPNCLMDIFQNFHMKNDLKNQENLDIMGLSHWPYKKKNERALIQDILLMLNGT